MLLKSCCGASRADEISWSRKLWLPPLPREVPEGFTDPSPAVPVKRRYMGVIGVRGVTTHLLQV